MKLLLRYFMEASVAPDVLVATSYEDFCTQIREVHDLEPDTELRITHNLAVLKNTATMEMILEHYSDPEFIVSVKRDGDIRYPSECTSRLPSANQPVPLPVTLVDAMLNPGPVALRRAASTELLATSCGKDLPFKKPKVEATPGSDSKKLFVEHAKQKVTELLKTNFAGAAILEQANQDKYLPNLDYKMAMQIFVMAIRASPKSGQSVNELKFEYAVGFVNLFPIYKDPQTEWGCEAVFRRSSRPGGEPSGTLHNKFKNSGRAERKINRKEPSPKLTIKTPETVDHRPKLSSPCLKRSLSFNDENLECESVEDESAADSQMEVLGHIHWLKVNASEANRAEVLARLTKTFNNRSDSLHDATLDQPVTAYDILERYPCFLTITGLVDHDFKLMLPDQENTLIEKWPALKLKVKNWATQVLEVETGKSVMTDQLRDCMDSNPTDVPYLDELMTLRIMLSKLPSTNQAQRRGVKVSGKVVFSYLVDFQTNGTDVKQLLADMAREYDAPVAPYLLFIRSGKCIDASFVIVDHKAIPASTNVVKAFDTLFKSHYVFSLEYQRQLGNFMTFFQTAIYGIDTGNTAENTTVRSARIAFC